MNIRLCVFLFLLMLVGCSPSDNIEKNSNSAEDDLEIQYLEEEKAQELETELATSIKVTSKEIAQELVKNAELAQAEVEVLLLKEAQLKEQKEEERLLKEAELAKKKGPP
jgi:uncharacterized protein YcfL